MDWETHDSARIRSAGENPRVFPLPLSSPLVKVTGLNFDASASFRRMGWVQIAMMDGAIVSETLIELGSRIIEIPKWLKIYRVGLRPNKRLKNAEIIIERLTADSMTQFALDAEDYLELSFDSGDMG